MKYRLSHEIDNYPEPEDEGIIRVTARIFGQEDNSTFTTLLLAKDFIENDECSEYSPGCVLKVQLDLVPDYLDDDDDEDDDFEIQEAAQVSFDDTSSIWFRPVSKLVVKICLQEFSNGGMVVTLPCGHEFDDECIVKWFEISHVCPLCRLEFPCQEDEI
ncbi:hypothetical protein Bca101_066590 [Brassica carinata]